MIILGCDNSWTEKKILRTLQECKHRWPLNGTFHSRATLGDFCRFLSSQLYQIFPVTLLNTSVNPQLPLSALPLPLTAPLLPLSPPLLPLSASLMTPQESVSTATITFYFVASTSIGTANAMMDLHSVAAITVVPLQPLVLPLQLPSPT